MGLLDSDEEELRRKQTSTGSGRKVNQSGLGAFKGINKYANLTAKYRAASPPEVTSNLKTGYEVGTSTSVEQLRGTIDSNNFEVDTKKLQSSHEVGNELELGFAQNLGTDLVQSGYKEHLEKSMPNNIQDTKWVQKIESIELEIKLLDAKSAASTASYVPALNHENILNSDLNRFNDTYSGYKVDNSNNMITSETTASSIQTTDKETEFDSGYEVGSKSTTTDNQSDYKVDTKSAQKINTDIVKVKNKISKNEISKKMSVQSSHEVGNFNQTTLVKPDTLSIQSRYEPDTTVGTKKSNKVLKIYSDSLVPLESVLSQMGDQKIVVDFIYDQCVWTGSLVTPPITKQQMLAGTGIKADSLKMSVKRLREKQIIDKDSFKDGKGGWTKYKISEIAYRDLTNLRKSISLNQNIYAVKVGTNLGTISPSKIVSNNLNNLPILTSEEVGTENLNRGWFKNLDFSKVRPIGPMQVNSSIRNLVEQKLDQDDAQNFINRFMSWMSLQTRVNNPLGLFCDKFKEYATEGDSAILVAVTEEERQIEIELAERFEKMRAENELILKHREESIKRKQDDDFEAWFNSLTSAEKTTLVPTNSYMAENSPAHRAVLKERFIESIQASL